MAVYIVRAGHDGPIKIGKAADVQARVAALQTAHHEKLSVIAVINSPDDSHEEARLHARFASFRMRGEWFQFSADVASLCSANPPPFGDDKYSDEGSVSGFIAALGGNRPAAAIFGVRESAVCNWKAANAMPYRLHLRALKLAAERGISFDPEKTGKRRKAA